MCDVEKPAEEFTRNRRNADGLYSYCKACVRRGRTLWPSRLPEYTRRDNRARLLRRLYGLTVEDFEALVDAQGGVCKLGCGRPATHVDHDHETGRVRGVLCLSCNAAIGIIAETPDQWMRLAAHLER